MVMALSSSGGRGMLPIGSVGMLSVVVAAQHCVALDDYDPPDAALVLRPSYRRIAHLETTASFRAIAEIASITRSE
jgi:hypothetical protein